MKLSREWSLIRFLGLAKVLATAEYALVRDWREGRFRLPRPRPAPHTPGALQSAERVPSGADFQFERAQLEVRFTSPEMVNLTWLPGTLPPPYAVLDKPRAALDCTLKASGEGWLLFTEQLTLQIGAAGGVTFLNHEGHLLRKDLPPARMGDGWTHRSVLAPEAHIYGTGERALGLNLRFQQVRLWNYDPGGYGPGRDPLYLTIPLYLCLDNRGCYLLFYDNSHDGSLSFDAEAAASFEAGALRYYFLAGALERIYELYADLTGLPTMPPLWSLGYHQSRFSYMSEAEVRELVGRFQELDLPLSAVHLDIDYMAGYRVFSVNRRRFPEMQKLADDLLRTGVRLIPILDPGIKLDPRFPVYKDGRTKAVFVRAEGGRPFRAPVWPGWVRYPDFSAPEARAWWGDQMAKLLELGAAGFWNDMNEPVAFAAWGDRTFPKRIPHAVDGQPGTHAQIHNLYGLLMNRAGYEGLRRLAPDRRPWQLSRSGWAGLQRYAWTWTGDTETSWAALRRTIPTVLGLSLSGIPYSGPDVGGFMGSPSAELYLRWLQLAALMPFFRTHSGKATAPREPWSFGDRVLEQARSALRLRVRLLPYLYSQAWQTSRTGLPIVRPLFWVDVKDSALWGAEDAFLLGESLLVAPILQEGGRSRALQLPAGRWYELSSGATFEGPGRVWLSAELDQIPILVRAGSVLPLEEADRLILRIYPPGESAGGGLLYSDAGDGYRDWRVDRFGLTQSSDAVELRWQATGRFAFPYAQVELQPRGFEASGLLVDEQRAQLPEGMIRAQPFGQARFELAD
jgi:alpha-glucosidase